MTEIARSMAYQDLYWRSSDGLRLHARDYAAAPGGSGLPVICIPGLTRNAADFHELWSTVGAAYRPIHGLGELAIYDTAERLRHRLKLESTHVIYLHSGARIGARRLAGGC